MRTTINIDDVLFEKVMRLVGATTKTEAVNRALREFVRLRAKDELLTLRGKLTLDDSVAILREEEKNEG